MEPVNSNDFEKQVDLIDPLKGLEKNYRLEQPTAWWLALLGPFVLTAAILATFAILKGPEVAYAYIGAGMAAFFAFGRFIILLGFDEPDPDGLAFLKYLDAKNLFCMLTYMDTMVAVFVAYHMGVVFRIPFVGPKILSMVSDGRFILKKQPWIRRAAFIGLVMFVIFPTSTTGSVGGSIFGRILGMKRWRVVIAILSGSILGNGLMLAFSEQLSKFNDSWQLRIIGVLAMLAALFIFERNIRRLKEQYEAAEQEVQKAMASTTESSEVEQEISGTHQESSAQQPVPSKREKMS
ncbi:MAG: small multi-drug export protein [Planctomycetota bacterium]